MSCARTDDASCPHWSGAPAAVPCGAPEARIRGGKGLTSTAGYAIVRILVWRWLLTASLEARSAFVHPSWIDCTGIYGSEGTCL